MRPLLLAVLVATDGCAWATGGGDTGRGGLPFTEVASGETAPGDGDFDTATGPADGQSLQVVLASTPEELAAMAAEIGIDPPDIDLTGKVAVGSYMYASEATGYILTVDRVDDDGAELVVHETLSHPYDWGESTVTRPWTIITLDDAGYTSVTGELTVAPSAGG